MPKPVKESETPITATTDGMVPVRDDVVQPRVPIIMCRVVYLGPARNKSVALPGRIMVEEFEQEAGGAKERIKEAVEVGISSYDFSSHDSRGRIITERTMPDTGPANLKGRPFSAVEHMEHIRFFYLHRDDAGNKEFEVLARPDDMQRLREYIRTTERQRRVENTRLEEVVAGT